MSIRSTAKAIILHNEKILLNKCYDINNGEYYSLPGGGQNQYETLQNAVIRECFEETGYTVKIVRFAALSEEICMDPFIRENRPDYAHKMYHIFLCELVNEKRMMPSETDIMQVASEWIDIDDLNNIRILPRFVRANIRKIINSTSPIFLGSENIDFNHG